MAKKRDDASATPWTEVRRLFEAGDPGFVPALRGCADAEELGAFAARWFQDPRPQARQFLREYLDLPLDAFRHEPLVKRLFKLAEKAGDDEVMGCFLVLFDRSVRRLRLKRRRFESASFKSKEDAENWRKKWLAEGYQQVHVSSWGRTYQVSGMRIETLIRAPRDTTMPRERFQEFTWGRTTHRMPVRGFRHDGTPEPQRRLFTVHTRKYLRRRAWRYFRRLGRQHPERYVPAVAALLRRYRDADTADGLALLDNWGLLHVLFHHSPVLRATAGGWTLAPGRTLAELEAAPAFGKQWQDHPRALLGLLADAPSLTVRRWVLSYLRRDGGQALAGLPLDDRLRLLAHPDEDVALVAAGTLRGATGLEQLTLEQWLGLLETPHAVVLETVAALMAELVRPERLTLEQTVLLATRRPLPVARLGFGWLQTHRPATAADCRAVLALAEAEAAPLRPEMLQWARAVLGASPHFEPVWLLDFLDSRHDDVRAAAWEWLLAEPRARDDVTVWQRLFESPHDDVRQKLVQALEGRLREADPKVLQAARLDAAVLRLLWAAVLLNVHRGGRSKPVVVDQLVRRLAKHPAEAADLLPLLAAAVRSVRGPEWRAGLAGVVRLVDRHPDLAPVVLQALPELALPGERGA